MAITFVSSTSAGDNATSIAVSDPASVQENDFYIAICSKADDAHLGVWSTPAGWSKLTEEYTSTGGTNDQSVGVFYRVRGASPVGSTSFVNTSAAGNIHVALAAYRGVDTSTPFDVAYSSGSHYAHQADSATGGTAAAITTATNNALVALLCSTGGTSTAHGAPSGYTLDATHIDGFMRSACFASKTVSSFGTETPGAWTHSLAAGSETNSITVALKPATVTTLYPDMEPLYYGAVLMPSKSNIEYAVWLGTAFNTEPDAYGTNGTTDASGVFQFPGAGFAGTAADPATVGLYWEEGDPPENKSIIVKTTLTAV